MRLWWLLLLILTAACAGNCAPAAPPADAVVLFDGKDISGWVSAGTDKPAGWKVENGYMEARGGNICSKRTLTDFQLHIEFWLPLMAEATGQARANSGVYLQGSYEIQVLDSYRLVSQPNDCGAIYGVAAPLVNACRPPETWQTYDAFFAAPRFDDKGAKTASARVSVLHNGVWIHEGVEIPQPTTAAMDRDIKAPGPIMLQDHGCPVRYRNIWIRNLTRDTVK